MLPASRYSLGKSWLPDVTQREVEEDILGSGFLRPPVNAERRQDSIEPLFIFRLVLPASG
jgi:hypothetical protein